MLWEVAVGLAEMNKIAKGIAGFSGGSEKQEETKAQAGKPMLKEGGKDILKLHGRQHHSHDTHSQGEGSGYGHKSG